MKGLSRALVHNLFQRWDRFVRGRRGPDPCLRKGFGIRFGSVGKTSELQCLRGLILQASTLFSSYLEMLCSEALSRLQHEQYTSRAMGSELTSSVLLWKSSTAKDGPLHLKL